MRVEVTLTDTHIMVRFNKEGEEWELSKVILDKNDYMLINNKLVHKEKGMEIHGGDMAIETARDLWEDLVEVQGYEEVE
jgi:hypothetical protein